MLYSSLLAQERGLGVIRSEGKKPIIASEEQHESLLSCCPSDAKYIFDIIASEEQHESLLSCCPSDAKYIFDIISSSLLTPPTLPYTRGGMKRVSPITMYVLCIICGN